MASGVRSSCQILTSRGSASLLSSTGLWGSSYLPGTVFFLMPPPLPPPRAPHTPPSFPLLTLGFRSPPEEARAWAE